MGGEAWIYWFWARVFKETGHFIILDRSPLYIIYLNLFTWMQYPLSVIAERIVTSFIGMVSMVALFKQYVKIPWAIFASLIWLPFLQTADPPVQFLGLSCTCLAMTIRITRKGRFWNALFYTLLIMSYLFRPSYLIILITFVVWDIYLLIRQERGFSKKIFFKLNPKREDWPVFVISLLVLFFLVFQSPLSWNNAWGSTSDWFPAAGSSALNNGFLHQFNGAYIAKQANFKNEDFYFTNQIIFKGASNVIGAFSANPRFVLLQISRNYANLPLLLSFFTALSSFTTSPQIVNFIKDLMQTGSPLLLITIALPCFIFAFLFLYGVFKECKYNSMIFFVVGTLIIVLMLSVFTVGRPRYFVPVIPILVLGAFYFGKRTHYFLKTKRKYLLSIISLPLFLIIFSNIIFMVGTIVPEKSFNFTLLENPDYSLKATQSEINNLILNCKGVMVAEHQFVGAFMNIPLKNVYDIWEIPPFGSYNNSTYNGLYPERIDCLLISEGLTTPTVTPTNGYIRYENYLKPYSEYLQEKGARTYQIPRYGKVIIYESVQRNKIEINHFFCLKNNTIYSAQNC